MTAPKRAAAILESTCKSRACRDGGVSARKLGGQRSAPGSVGCVILAAMSRECWSTPESNALVFKPCAGLVRLQFDGPHRNF